MLINHEREKLLNAIIFFSKNTRHLGKIKLWKLLYLLDFQHYKDTGRSVTGLSYFAWPKGPVPVSLHNEMSDPGADMREKLEITRHQWEKGESLSFDAKAEFNPEHFTKRELRMLNELAQEFERTNADDMILRTHLENEPWHEIFVKRGREQQEIPYPLAVLAQEAEEISSIAEERKEMMLNYSAA
jgi:uncharacterized phage-associated protein